MHITYAKVVNGGHIRCTFEDEDGIRISGIAFGAEYNGIGEVLLGAEAERVHICGRLKLDTWNGRKKMDLLISDIARA